MKSLLKIILILLQYLFFISCEMDPAYSTKPDSYYFNKMQPLEWKDTYILTATNTPQQIQVWDGEKGKLVHTYSLSTDVTKWGQGTERALDILDMEIDEDITIYTEADKFLSVKEELDNLGYDKYIMSEVTYVPDNYMALDEESTEKVLSLIEALENIDDVQNVYHNLEI